MSHFILDAGLLDIGKEMAEVTGHEKVFYLDQQSTRVYRLSEEIDEGYKQIQQAVCETVEQLNQQHEDEYNFIMMDDDEEALSKDDSFLDLNTANISLNRSGHA